MALIKCPDCSREISTEASACPGCGRPMGPAAQGEPPRTAAAPQPGPTAQPAPMVVETVKNRGVYIVLGLFFGALGIHNFYAGYYGKGAAQLIITLLLGWIVVGLVITWIWALVEICTVKADARGNPMS